MQAYVPAVILTLTGIILVVFWNAFFFWSRHAERKRPLYPWFLLLVGLWSVVLVWCETRSVVWVLLFIPGAMLAGYVNLRLTRFCALCGTPINGIRWAGASDCPCCGAALVAPETAAS